MRPCVAFVIVCIVAYAVAGTGAAAGVSPDTGSLTVRSDPNGAEVFLDTERVGTTPLTIPEVSPGTHVLLISLSGFEDHAAVVTVEPGKNAVYTAILHENMGRTGEIAIGIPLDLAGGFNVAGTLAGLCVLGAAWYLLYRS